MGEVPDRFRAFIAERVGDQVRRGVGTLAAADLPPGDVQIRVAWSGVNYKDGLATVANGKVARISPLVPGIDLAGKVVASGDPSLPVGANVLAHGYDIGVARHGGYAEYACVPADYVVPLPDGMTPRESMVLGTAGFTAGLMVARLEAADLAPERGPVLVTGATGGVGRTALAILVARGYEAWASTGKPEAHAELLALGAAGIVSREELAAESPRALDPERWAGAVDCVGGATLPAILRSLRRGGAVAACGNAGGPTLVTTVFPFILRGVSLIGADSAETPIADRRRLWQRLATDLRPRDLGAGVTEIELDGLEGALTAILAGQARGRWVVRIGGQARA